MGYLNESSTRYAMAELLNDMAPMRNLSLVQEVTRTPQGNKGRIVYDGILIRNRDQFDFGYWESKDQNDNLDIAIEEKIKKGYSLVNTFFENTKHAVLYQDGKEILKADLKNEQQFEYILIQFFLHDQRIFDDFQSEKERFAEQIEGQAKRLFREVEQKKKEDAPFGHELIQFHEYCKKFLNSDTRIEDVEKMLVQHILTETVFQEILLSSDILKYNRMGPAVKGLLDSFYNYSTEEKINKIL